MNGSFRAQEPQMLRQRHRQMMKDKEEELQLFLEMSKREKECDDLLLDSAEEFDAPLGTNQISRFILVSEILSSFPLK